MDAVQYGILNPPKPFKRLEQSQRNPEKRPDIAQKPKRRPKSIGERRKKGAPFEVSRGFSLVLVQFLV